MSFTKFIVCAFFGLVSLICVTQAVMECPASANVAPEAFANPCREIHDCERGNICCLIVGMKVCASGPFNNDRNVFQV
uniref:Uncharacterized protein n=1 Tax=Timema poppense TaxID=170557 RepID=A0A7R9HHM6_TIMPO|nr:unnamed protein product [Timema poppensis]